MLKISQVYREEPSSSAIGFRNYLLSHQFSVDLVPLTATDDLRYDNVIFFAEIEKPLFLTITPEEWNGFKHILLASTSAIWVTGGALLDNGRPEYAMMSGLAGAIRAENPLLRLALVDLDSGKDVLRHDHFDILRKIQADVADPSYRGDLEFRVKSGVAYVSRLESDDVLNENARSKRNRGTTTDSVPFNSLRELPMALVTDKPGDMSTLHFEEEDCVHAAMLQDTDVEIDVKAVEMRGMASTTVFSDARLGVLTALVGV